MKKTHNGEKVYAMSDKQVAIFINFLDGYIEQLTGKKRENVDALCVVRNIKSQIIK